LQAARSLMLVNGRDAASAAFEVGYESATQFNREYSRFFGQPPMRDSRASLAERSTYGSDRRLGYGWLITRGQQPVQRTNRL
jgi:AraC-like DNA-binding protein